MQCTQPPRPWGSAVVSACVLVSILSLPSKLLLKCLPKTCSKHLKLFNNVPLPRRSNPTSMVPEAPYKLTCSLSHLLFQSKFFTPSPLLRSLQSWFQCPHPRMLCAAPCLQADTLHWRPIPKVHLWLPFPGFDTEVTVCRRALKAFQIKLTT